MLALAVLFELMGRDADAVRGAPKLHLLADLRAATKSLRRRPMLLASIAGSIG